MGHSSSYIFLYRWYNLIRSGKFRPHFRPHFLFFLRPVYSSVARCIIAASFFRAFSPGICTALPAHLTGVPARLFSRFFPGIFTGVPARLFPHFFPRISPESLRGSFRTSSHTFNQVARNQVARAASLTQKHPAPERRSKNSEKRPQAAPRRT